MTQIEFLEEELQKLEVKYISMILEYRKEKRLIFEKYKEIHKQQIIDAYYGYELYLDREFRFQQGGQAKILTFDQWYETYVSKGSGISEKQTSSTTETLYTEEQVIDFLQLRLMFFGIATNDSENEKWLKQFKKNKL